MKFISGLSAVILLGLLRTFSPEAAHAQTPLASLPAAEVSRIKAQEFSRALAQLKIQEVAIQNVAPVDEKTLTLNRAQQSALNQELVNLAVAPLERERQQLALDLTPRHPRMIALTAEIEKAKASITGGR